MYNNCEKMSFWKIAFNAQLRAIIFAFTVLLLLLLVFLVHYYVCYVSMIGYYCQYDLYIPCLYRWLPVVIHTYFFLCDVSCDVLCHVPRDVSSSVNSLVPVHFRSGFPDG